MNDHVGKPFDINDLVRVLRSQAKWGAALPAPATAGPTVGPGAVLAADAAGIDLAAALLRLGGGGKRFIAACWEPLWTICWECLCSCKT